MSNDMAERRESNRRREQDRRIDCLESKMAQEERRGRCDDCPLHHGLETTAQEHKKELTVVRNDIALILRNVVPNRVFYPVLSIIFLLGLAVSGFLWRAQNQLSMNITTHILTLTSQVSRFNALQQVVMGNQAKLQDEVHGIEIEHRRRLTNGEQQGP